MKILKNRLTNEVAIIVSDEVPIVLEDAERNVYTSEDLNKLGQIWVDNEQHWKVGETVVKYIDDCCGWFDPEGDFLTNWDGALLLEVVENITTAPLDKLSWQLYNKYIYVDGVWSLNVNYVDPLLQSLKEDVPQ
tara:strand:- start:350 stop:751 length:402 start_codon:yes stop_codon:yes gene_type:complete